MVPENWKKTFKRLAGECNGSPASTAGAVVLAASLFKVNRLIAGAASNISLPPVIPFIVYASLKTGGVVMGRSASPVVFIRTLSFQTAKACAAQYVVGSILLAFFCALAAWGLAYAAAMIVSKRTSVLEKSI